jgi:hypothetical protein
MGKRIAAIAWWGWATLFALLCVQLVVTKLGDGPDGGIGWVYTAFAVIYAVGTREPARSC